MSWRDLPNVKGRQIVKNDRVYIMNEYEKCALKLGEETKECYQVITSTNLNEADQWTIEFVYSKEGSGIRLRTNKLPSRSDRNYIMYGEWGGCKMMAMGKASDNNHTIFILKDDKGMNVENPKYGESYRLSPLKSPSLNLQMSSSGNIVQNGIVGTEKWVFLPTTGIPSKYVNSPLCYYLSDYSTSTGRCGKVQDLINTCGAKLADICTENSQVFGPGPCKNFLLSNPEGIADDAIETICYDENNIEKSECACVGPTKNMAPTKEIPDYKLYWACYGNYCKKNKSNAFVLSGQRKKCPAQAICYFEKEGDRVPKIVFAPSCKIDDGNKKKEKNVLKWVFIVSSIILGGGIIWYLFIREDKPTTRIPYYNTPYNNTPYNNLPYSYYRIQSNR